MSEIVEDFKKLSRVEEAFDKYRSSELLPMYWTEFRAS